MTEFRESDARCARKKKREEREGAKRRGARAIYVKSSPNNPIVVDILILTAFRHRYTHIW